MSIKLTELSIGEPAVISGFENDGLSLKLMEMGCLPGESVVIDKIAPAGDPISIIIAGYHLSLRKEEAEVIKVDLIA